MIEALLALQLFFIGAAPQIDVVYPRIMEPDSIPRIARVDSNFIFGSVHPPESELYIDGHCVETHPNGAFLAFLPVDWFDGVYELTAIDNGDTTFTIAPFSTYPPPEPTEQPEYTLPAFLTLNGGVARNHPRGSYYLFPLPETKVLSTGWSNGYFEIPISVNRSVWIADYYVSQIDSFYAGEPPVAWRIDLTAEDSWERLTLPLPHKVLYRIHDETDPDRLIIDLFGVVSHIDLISYPASVKFIKEVRWDQPNDDILRLEVKLKSASWGYKVDFDDEGLIVNVRKPPQLRDKWKTPHIGVDPGHGGEQDGAIGPTRLKEKDINLAVSLELAEFILDKGWQVSMTRSSDCGVGLRDRIKLAEFNEADLLVSVHHNALPDGKDPFGYFGVGTYYYHSQSRDLAECVQKEVVEELKIPNEGIYYNNLALARPTSMPAILIENAYLMLPEQEAMMRGPDYPERLAKAIYRGIKKFLELRKK